MEERVNASFIRAWAQYLKIVRSHTMCAQTFVIYKSIDKQDSEQESDARVSMMREKSKDWRARKRTESRIGDQADYRR